MPFALALLSFPAWSTVNSTIAGFAKRALKLSNGIQPSRFLQPCRWRFMEQSSHCMVSPLFYGRNPGERRIYMVFQCFCRCGVAVLCCFSLGHVSRDNQVTGSRTAWGSVACPWPLSNEGRLLHGATTLNLDEFLVGNISESTRQHRSCRLLHSRTMS